MHRNARNHVPEFLEASNRELLTALSDSADESAARQNSLYIFGEQTRHKFLLDTGADVFGHPATATRP